MPLIILVAGFVTISTTYTNFKVSQQTETQRLLRADLDGTRNDLKDAEAEISDLRSTQRQNKSRIGDLETDLEQTNKALATTNDENKRLSGALEAAKRQRDEDIREQERLSKDLKTLQDNYADFQKRAAEDKRQDTQLIQGLRSELETAHRNTDTWQKRADEYQQQRAQLQITVDEMNGHLQGLRTEMSALTEERNKMREQMDNLARKVGTDELKTPLTAANGTTETQSDPLETNKE